MGMDNGSVLLGLGGAGAGAIAGGPVGAAIGGLAGVGADKVRDKIVQIIDRYTKKDDEDKEKEDKEDTSDKNKKEAQYMDEMYKKAFVEQCKKRGVDPADVLKFAKATAIKKQKQAEAVQKQAAAMHDALKDMTPYQRGFAMRCYERGYSAQKVAEFCAKLAK